MAQLQINEKQKLATIHEEVYGHFAEHLGRCIYEGLYVGEDSEIPNKNGMRTDVVEALKEMKIPVLRWPGGCFADEYHWKDGIGPKETRKRMVNTHWGGVIEDNSFGTHEFMELCEQLGCKTYINGNVGSGTVQEMSEWVEYLTFDGVSPMAELRKKNGHEKPWKVDFFGVGNENWGCGGNMTPEHYANEYRRYQTYVRNYNQEQPIFKICGGPNVDDYSWTRGVLETTHRNCPSYLHGLMDGLSLHYYVHPGGWENKGSATEFGMEDWYKTLDKALYIETLIKRHTAIMDQYDPDQKIGLIVDEWGAWYDVEPGTNPGFLYQQNTMRDAIVAAISLNVFNKHADRVRMANIAQMINVLQSVILTEGSKMVLTPTYFVFCMYKMHQNATLLQSHVETGTIGKETKHLVPQVSESVSVGEDGVITITLANLSYDAQEEMDVVFSQLEPKEVSGELLYADANAFNCFEAPEQVKKVSFDAFAVEGKHIRFTLPAHGVISIRVK
ncbi:MAG: alpha-L-arabinofuranosidase [Clostridiales bacterium]|nr:alpha-L-arabinofuranosidase [Clostridiales bacterium]